MRKFVASAIVLAILTSPAFSQNREDEPLVTIEKEKQRQTEALDKQYKRTMERTRKDSDKTRNDPWASMRSPNDGKR